MTTRGVKTSLIILFILVFISIGLNVYLISELLRVQQQVSATARDVRPVVTDLLSETITDLDELQTSTVEVSVNIDDEFPVDTTILIDEAIDVPIKMTFPVKEEVQTTLMLEPFGAGVEVPVDITVPVDLEVPVDIVVPVQINRTIPISANIPVKLDVPVAIDLSETPLAGYLSNLQRSLASLEQTVDQFLEGLE